MSRTPDPRIGWCVVDAESGQLVPMIGDAEGRPTVGSRMQAEAAAKHTTGHTGPLLICEIHVAPPRAQKNH